MKAIYNIFNDSTQSIYNDSGNNFTLNDSSSSVTTSLNGCFNENILFLISLITLVSSQYTFLIDKYDEEMELKQKLFQIFLQLWKR